MTDVSILGLGAMGAALAKTLVTSGYEVTVWNRTASKANPLVELGAQPASTSEDAIDASPVTIVCVTSQADTLTLVQSAGDLVAGKQIIDLSTGSGTEAEALDELIRERGAELLTGMILSYPSGIGSDETAILVAGPGDGWERCRDIVMKLAGSSVHISDRPAALAVLFSALFLPRQAFMFGMIAGARLVEAAGIPVETYVSQLPQTLSAAQFYVQLVGETIPSESYSDPGASIEVYAAAYRDMLKTFGDLGVNAELPELLYNKVEQGLEAGYGDEELTALIKLLR